MKIPLGFYMPQMPVPIFKKLEFRGSYPDTYVLLIENWSQIMEYMVSCRVNKVYDEAGVEKVFCDYLAKYIGHWLETPVWCKFNKNIKGFVMIVTKRNWESLQKIDQNKFKELIHDFVQQHLWIL